MAKKAKIDLPHHVKIRKLTNVLVSYYGMKEAGKDYTGAKKHLNNHLTRYALTKDAILEAMPAAKEIIRQRSLAFVGGHTVSKAL